jgi:hypothetical protein
VSADRLGQLDVEAGGVTVVVDVGVGREVLVEAMLEVLAIPRDLRGSAAREAENRGGGKQHAAGDKLTTVHVKHGNPPCRAVLCRVTALEAL